MSTRPQLVFDYAQTKTFLAVISGDWETELFTWQPVDDNRDRKIKSKVENNTLENIAGFLETKNRNGHAIFVTVNKTDGTGREARNIVSIRAIWCDWDHADRPLPTWPIAPHITVNTSPGKYQFLWCCESLSPETFKQAMTRMIELGSDPGAKDVSRVLRVPGFFHQKKCTAKDQIGAPFLVQITQQNDIPHYTAAEIATAFQPLKPNGHDHTPPEPPAALSAAEEARLRGALEVIPADERKIWLTIGMALHAVGARTIWDDWSKTCPEAFDQADQDKTWAGFKDDRENGITIATVYHTARKAGWHEPPRAKPDDGYVPPGETSVPPAPPNRDNLVISAWLTKEIPPRDHLLGGIMCTTSRLLVLGETGIGKTLVGMAMGGAISAGMNFLRWAGQRRSRVMYLDGELPIETFKERMELVAALYGQDIEFYGYNRDDLGDAQMPPLNIEDGQKWLRREIEAINPDLIFFDSIMSLLMGTMSEEESWTPMKRLVRELTSRRIAQAWLHHTNDLGKGFGTKTREWEMDTVAALSRHADDEGTPDDGAIKFEFRKTRLCTPANVEQFKPLIIHPGDEWRFEDAQKCGAKRQSDASILAREILKAYDRLSDGVVKCPGLDGQPVRMVKTDTIRDELKSRGFLDHNDGTITPASRTMLCKAKTMLLKDVRLVENEGLVWRP